MDANKKIKRIAILTGGGDCSGLNAVIRAAVRTAILKYGYEVIGYMGGYYGLFKDDYIDLTLSAVTGIFHQGGTILKMSNRDNLFNYRTMDSNGNYVYLDVSDIAIENLRKNGVDAIIIIGGDGTLTSARDFSRKGVNVVGIPKTIDNDVPDTEITFGYRTALDHIMLSLDALHTTAFSHDRVMILEVMGRHAGWLALEGGIAGSADVILIPEIPYDIKKVAKQIIDRYNYGSKFSIICVSEGAKPIDGELTIRTIDNKSPDSVKLGGIGARIASQLETLIQPITGQEIRSTNLGYIQRGGVTDTFDRVLGTKYGSHAVDMIANGEFGNMVTIMNDKMTMVPIEDVVGHGKTGETSRGGARLVDPEGDLVQAARNIGISFGD
ncbi:MAG TPA: ATP-dependent 6-phosphofructokinase [Bacillota bacterium]|nr:ATP-dependent 6-phosphofructokinase [Bacillota bacterium]HPF41885.1 ATP-dependent 6-phosphofructokinase [Bacillota bacterium]HPJ85642.1 ATP-dependent 6-phosphofructokinase [Bacillota bacterium]HPQ61406.1 ATP-dependent 6-phosphofructokinase [Bacillota bacterium]HRX91294.1 ATP-dependent 6-phosphofructokinase [Candidatus Izemoplasmatales bacterium]